jgi:hypothetical protein
MKRLIIFGLVIGAAWYGWKHWPEFVERRPGHLAVIENASTSDLARVRVVVDGQTLVKEVIPAGSSASLPFKITNDSAFDLVWEYQGRIGERRWHGGEVFKGPMMQRHVFRVDDDAEVMYHAENR